MIRQTDIELLDWMVKVQDFRREMAERSSWATPDAVNCLRFAVAKAGKAMEAWICLSQPLVHTEIDYKYQLKHNLTAMAVCLATPLTFYDLSWVGVIWPDSSDMDKICGSMLYTFNLKLAEDKRGGTTGDWCRTAIHTLRLIWLYPELNLTESTTEYFNLIRIKHQAR